MPEIKKLVLPGIVIIITVFAGIMGIAYYKHTRSLKFLNITLLDKPSLLKIMRSISLTFSGKFASIQEHNRRKRRKLDNESREYMTLVYDLRDKARSVLERATEEVLNFNQIAEETYSDSFQHFEEDPEVVRAVTNLCTVVEFKTTGFLDRTQTEAALQMYLDKIRHLPEGDVYVRMKAIEDEIYHEFGVEMEEIESAARKYGGVLSDFVEEINETNEIVLEKAEAFIL